MKLIITLLALLCIAAKPHAQAFSDDLSFGVDGLTTDSRCLYAKDVKFYDDKYYIVGNNGIAALNYDGTFVSSFGLNGFSSLPTNQIYSVNGSLITNDFIYIWGYFNWSSSLQTLDGFIARFNRITGAADTTFGDAGITVLDFGFKELCKGLVIDATGNLYAAVIKDVTTSNISHYSMLVAKVLANGTIDTSFGTSGYKTFLFGFDTSVGQIFPYENGFILPCIVRFTATSGSNFCLLKLDANGNADTGFAPDGLKILPDIIGYSGGTSIIQCIQKNGKIYTALSIAGALNTGGNKFAAYDFATETLTIANQSLPKYFISFNVGVDGKIYYHADDSPSPTDQTGQLRCYNSNLTSDSSFNVTGNYYVDLNTSPFGNSYCAVNYPHEDGKIFLSGRQYSGYSCQFGAKRIMPGTLATNEYAQTLYQVSPNPTTNYLEITSDAAIDHISIVDLAGKTVIQKSGNIFRTDVQALHQGVYFLNIVSGNSTTTLRFVKQ